MAHLTSEEQIALGRMKQQFDAWSWPLSRVINWIAFGDAECFEKSVLATRRYSAGSIRSVDPYGSLFRAFQAGLIRPIEDDAEWETWTDPPSPRNWPNCYFHRDDVLSIWPGRFRSIE